MKKILIGTPIHECKDYSMERWLKNVNELTQVYPCDILMVDNSPGLDYMKKVKDYCDKYKIKNYKIRHLEITQGEDVDKNFDEQIHERVAYCQEEIRNEALGGGYDAWFSWECDQIIPTNTLEILLKIMDTGSFLMVNHNCWNKSVEGGLCFDFGVTLVDRKYLLKYSFLLDKADPYVPDSWYNAQTWYRTRMIRNGDAFTDVFGIVNPILHLSN